MSRESLNHKAVEIPHSAYYLLPFHSIKMLSVQKIGGLGN